MGEGLAVVLVVEGLQVQEVQVMVADLAVVLVVEGLQVQEVQAMVATEMDHRAGLHRLSFGPMKSMVEGFCLFHQTFPAALSFPFAEFFFQDGRFLHRFQTSL